MTRRYIGAELRQRVLVRAAERCEYCALSQAGQEATFHVDHIQPVKSGGETQLDNLAFACVSCSLRKAARRDAIDPKTGQLVRLFHPRSDSWDAHFRWEGDRVVGKTAIGRATVEALQMNRELVVAIRCQERLLGRHPPGV